MTSDSRQGMTADAAKISASASAKGKEESSQGDLERGTFTVDDWEAEISMLSLSTKGGRVTQSIPRVFPHLRKQDPDGYEPKLISIGPLHRGKSELLAMEGAKLYYLSRILQDKPKILPLLFDAARGCVDDARKCYSVKFTLSDDEFAKMLVLDGCFIHALSEKSLYKESDVPTTAIPEYNSLVLRDLMLLENQIPFFVVCALLRTIDGVDGPHIYSEALSRQPMLINIPPNSVYPPDIDVRHLLHLMHKCTIEFEHPYETPRGCYFLLKK